MALIPCPECRAQISDRAVACPHCGCPTPKASGAKQPVEGLWSGHAPVVRPLGPVKYIYAGSLLVGLAIAGYIYLLHFDDFSETALVQLTPLWFFFLVLGYYGLVAERMLVREDATLGEVVANSLFDMIKDAAPGPVGKLFAVIVHLPFLVVRSRRSWVVAVAGAAMWAVALWAFFTLIFPSL